MTKRIIEVFPETGLANEHANHTGINFRKQSQPPKISGFEDYCLLTHVLKVGDVVTAVILNPTENIRWEGFDSTELIQYLKQQKNHTVQLEITSSSSSGEKKKTKKKKGVAPTHEDEDDIKCEDWPKHNMEEDDIPSNRLIRLASKEVAMKVDMDDTSLKKFMTLIQSELGCSNLAPKKAFIKLLYEDATGNSADVEEEKTRGSSSRSPKRKKKVVTSSDKVTVKQAQSVRQPEAALVATPVVLPNHSPQPPTPTRTEAPTSSKKKGRPIQHSEDLEQGRIIPEAAGLKWKDTHFDDVYDRSDLVGVFDYDRKKMLWYYMKREIIGRTVPILITLLTLIFLITAFFAYAPDMMEEEDAAADGYGSINLNDEITVEEAYDDATKAVRFYRILLTFITLIWLGLNLYGVYRLEKSQVYALHLGVFRDGVRTVYAEHLDGRPVVAAFHIFDCCLRRPGVSQTVPFDLITMVTVRDPGERDTTPCPCCCCCCPCCFVFPFYTVELATGTSYCAQAMCGIQDPHWFHKLVWAMKRAKGEQIHRDVRSELRFANNMNFGRTATNEVINSLATVEGGK